MRPLSCLSCRFRAVVAVVVFGVSGCGADDDPKQVCLDSSRAADSFPPPPAEVTDQVQADCLDAGLPDHDCNPANYITQGQAECIVRASDPPSGEWRVSLVFAAKTKRPIWNVRIDVGGGTAQHFGVDAITGDIVKRSTSTAVE